MAAVLYSRFISSSSYFLFRVLLVMMLSSGLANLLLAQQQPVSATLQLTPPYSIYLPDYALPGSEQMKLFLLLRDLSEPDYPVRLHLTVEGAGIRIESSPSFIPPPLTLQGGVPLVLSSTELAPYLNSRNLLFSGITLQQYEKRGALPEGFYRFTFKVLDYRRQDIVLSNAATFMAWFVLNDPPRINTPLCGTTLKLADPQTIMFQWMPGSATSPNAMLDTEYEFTLVEVRPKGRNPNDAILSGVPLYQTTTPYTSFLYGLTEPALIPGQQYAFRVQARDTQDRDLFKNQGYAEVCAFTYGEVAPLDPPEFVHVYADAERRAQVSWQMNITPERYRVEYRKQSPKGEGHAWFARETTSDQLTLYDLEPATTYEVKVASMFQNYASRYTGIQTFTTPARRVIACGQSPAPQLSEETAPLLTAIAGQYWQVGEFEMQLMEVRGGDGTFSGLGSITIPYLGLQVPVQFEGVKVNKDREVVWGEVVALREDVETFQQRWEETHPEEEPVTAEENAQDEGKEAAGQETATSLPTTDIVIPGVITTVQVSEQGEITVTDSEGKQTTYQQPEDTDRGEKKETVISDAVGNTYQVDKDGKITKDSSESVGSNVTNSNNLTSTELELMLKIQDQLVIKVM